MYSNVTTSTRINIFKCTYVHLCLFHSKLMKPLQHVSNLHWFCWPISQQLPQCSCTDLLPPTTKLRQGNVLTPVCHCVHRGLSATPWADNLLWSDTPLGRPLRQIHPRQRPPLGRHPPLMQIPPWPNTPKADTPRQTHTPAQWMLGCSQKAGSTLDTGMHSCVF